MPKREDSKTISSVSDILSFILTEAEKPPEKRKPIESESGDMQPESEYASALVDTLAMPGTFVGEQSMQTLQSLVDFQVKLQTQSGRPGFDSIKISASDIPNALRDPDTFIDKLFEKNRNLSKMQRLQWAGEAMRMALGSTYAKKKELFKEYDPEMQKVLERAMGQSAMQGNERDRIWMVDAAIRIRDKGSVGKRLKELEAKNPSQLTTQEKNWMNRVRGELETATKVHDEKFFHSFNSLLDSEFGTRKQHLLGKRDLNDLSQDEQDEYLKLTEAQGLLGVWGRYGKGGVSPSELKRTQNRLESSKDLLRKQKEALKSGAKFKLDGQIIDYSRYTRSQKSKELEHLNKRLKSVSTARRQISGMKFWSNLGNAEGVYWGLRNTLGPGGLEAVLNGDFFDPKKGYFGSPTVSADFNLFGTNAKVGFVKAKHVEGQALRNGYRKSMTTLYYLNPTTWIRSLASGEAFAWMAHRKQEKLSAMWGVKEGDFLKLKDRKFWQFYKEFKGATDDERTALLANNEEYRKLMGRLMRVLGDKDSNLAKKFSKAEKLFNSLERWGGLAKFLSAPKRFKDEIVKEALKKARNFIGNQLLKFIKDEGARALINSWKAVGGKALSGAISSAIVGALGLAGSAVAPALGTVIGIVVGILIDKILKIAFKVSIYLIALFFIIIFAIFSVTVSGLGAVAHQSKANEYSREIPSTVYEVEDFESYGNTHSGNNDKFQDPADPNEDWDGGGEGPKIPYDPVNGESLQDIYAKAQSFVSSTYGTVTVPLSIVSPGDYWYDWLSEWAWCVSTGGGIYCKGDKLSASSSTYVHNLFVHELIHRLQSGCSLQMSEWGADYLSNNAGGYIFDTPEGCVRATQVNTSSCSAEQKIEAALCQNTGGACFQEIARKVSGFCTR